MTEQKAKIAISVSAALSAISAITQVANDPQINTQTQFHASMVNTQYANVIDASMANPAAETELRRGMGSFLPITNLDPDTMRDDWLWLANASGEDVDNIIRDGSGRTNIGRILGPNSDSTLNDRMLEPTVPGLTACYTNCHSACHGSRSWR